MDASSTDCGVVTRDAIVKEEPSIFEFTEKGKFYSNCVTCYLAGFVNRNSCEIGRNYLNEAVKTNSV